MDENKKHNDNDIFHDDDSEYIIIPNPIYDVVFRYLMEDLESAKTVLSTLLNVKIIKLELGPHSHTEKKGKSSSEEDDDMTDKDGEDEYEDNYTEITIKDPKTKDDLRLFHLDFTALIQLKNGKRELAMIEIQKASEPGDIFRFKRYISKNFQKKRETEIINPRTHVVEKIMVPIRLIPIFILNFRVENEIKDLVIKISRTKSGVFTNKELQKENDFIDNLSYDLFVVQLPYLHNIKEEEYQNIEYKQKLYALLKIFDQKSKVRDNEHRLRLFKKNFPDFLERIIKRLQAADVNNPKLEEQMYAEDEYIQALVRRDKEIDFHIKEKEKKDQVINEKDQVISEKDQVISEKDQTLNEKDQAISEKDQVINEKDQVINEKDQAISEKDQAISEKDQAISEKDQVISEKDQAISEKDQVISEKDQVINEKDQAISEKDQAISEKDKKLIDLAKFLKESNFPIGIIVEKTGLDREDVESL